MQITRRKLFKNLGAFLGVAAVAPKLLAEPVEKVVKTYSFSDVNAAVESCDMAFLTANLAIDEEKIFRTLTLNSTYGKMATCWTQSKFMAIMDSLLGPTGWRITNDYERMIITIHVPSWLSDCHFEYLRLWGNNYRCTGELWMWKRGDEEAIEGEAFNPDYPWYEYPTPENLNK